MAELDPNTPQAVDPERVVDLTRLLQIRGPLGVLNVLDTIIPVVNMGDVVPRTTTVLQPAFRSTDVFSNGIFVAAAANSVLADTQQLAEGTYDVVVSAENTSSVSQEHSIQVQHRNAANAANLAAWDYIIWRNPTGGLGMLQPFAFAYELAINERIRVVNPIISGAGEAMNVVIFARRRT